jgi:hypothetical protein
MVVGMRLAMFHFAAPVGLWPLSSNAIVRTLSIPYKLKNRPLGGFEFMAVSVVTV